MKIKEVDIVSIACLVLSSILIFAGVLTIVGLPDEGEEYVSFTEKESLCQCQTVKYELPYREDPSLKYCARSGRQRAGTLKSLHIPCSPKSFTFLLLILCRQSS